MRQEYFVNAVVALMFVVTSYGATVRVEPVASMVTIAGTVDVNVVVGDITNLYAYQFDLTFDPSILQAATTFEGLFLPSAGNTFFVPGIIDNDAGTIGFTANTLLGPGGGVNGNGGLAIIRFIGAAVGTTPVSLSNVILLDSTITDIPAQIVNGSITVADSTQIPEASSVALIVVPLLVMFCKARQNATRPIC